MPKATGYCKQCGNRVPEDASNKFHCSEPCRIKTWIECHPEEPQPDWNAVHAYAAVMSQSKH